MNVPISSGNNPLALVYKTATENITKALNGSSPSDSVVPSTASTADVSDAAAQDNGPEATAGRIVSFATGLFNAYQARHPEMDSSTALTNFVGLIQKGVDQGFSEAKHILSGMGALTGSVASNVDKTYDLVEQGFANFTAVMTARFDISAAVAGSPVTSASPNS